MKLSKEENGQRGWEEEWREQCDKIPINNQKGQGKQK